MIKKNSNGFTLVELLATMVILGILMAIALPNVVGVLNNNRNKTYVADAKKLATQAEYKLRSSTSIIKPDKGNCVLMTLNYLDNNEFEEAPYGGSYDKFESYVIIKKVTSGTYKYYVRLVENIGSGDSNKASRRGVDLVESSKLYDTPANNLITNIGQFCELIYSDDKDKLLCYGESYGTNLYSFGTQCVSNSAVGKINLGCSPDEINRIANGDTPFNGSGNDAICELYEGSQFQKIYLYNDGRS